jgi:hypothetical protein
MTDYTFTGRIKEIKPVEKVGKNGIDKVNFICIDYNQAICFTLLGKNIKLIEGFAKDDNIEVIFTISSLEYSGKWYTNCTPSEITLVSRPSKKSQQQKQQKQQQTYNNWRGGQQKKKEEVPPWEESPKPPPKHVDWFDGCYSQEEIKKKYRKLCFEYHPDMPNGDVEIMKEINIQYSNLCR